VNESLTVTQNHFLILFPKIIHEFSSGSNSDSALLSLINFALTCLALSSVSSENSAKHSIWLSRRN
jgi:hypothetical protein